MRTLAVNGARLLGRRTAIGRHLEYLAQYWSVTKIPFDRVLIFTPGPTEVSGLGAVTPVTIQPVGSHVTALAWEQLLLPVVARRASVLLCEYAGPIVLPTAPMVVANHGIYEALPQTFGRVRRLRATSVNRPAAKRSRLVIANSMNTAADIERYFKVDPAKIRIIYPGAADIFFKPHARVELERAMRENLNNDAPFILFVGKLSARRNVPNLIHAIRRVRDEGFRHRLVIVGPDVDAIAPHRLAEQLGLVDGLVHIDHLEQDELALLYAAADLFVLPSTYEGISWTVFEAMASGTAVIGVDHPTMTEGAADAALVIGDPSVDELAGAMLTLLGDPKKRVQLEEAGKLRAEQFSLRESARATTAVLDEAARQSDR